MKTYFSDYVVKGEDLNHHGTLFGARAAAWFVEAGLLAAAREHGHLDEIVMRNILDMSFRKPVPNGTLLEFSSRIVLAGNTSLVVAITGRDGYSKETYLDGYIAYVTVEPGIRGKKPHGIVLDATEDPEELDQREKAKQLMESRRPALVGTGKPVTA